MSLILPVGFPKGPLSLFPRSSMSLLSFGVGWLRGQHFVIEPCLMRWVLGRDQELDKGPNCPIISVVISLLYGYGTVWTAS